MSLMNPLLKQRIFFIDSVNLPGLEVFEPRRPWDIHWFKIKSSCYNTASCQIQCHFNFGAVVVMVIW